MNSLAPLKEIAEKCVRCGICQSVCPVFAEVQREAAAARGKVTLIRNLLIERIGYSSKLSTYLLQCLGCGACSENCPNGVKADELILSVRALMVEKKGLSLPKWMILRGIIRSPHLLPLLLKTGSLVQGLLLKKIPKESGLHLRFSLPYLNKGRFIPSIKTPFFLDRYPDEVKGKDAQKRIGLFSGCSINYLYPSIGEATLRLLNQNHFSAVLPKDQTCCGLPAYGSGDIETAKFLLKKNIRAFQSLNLEQIIVPCASCFYFLKEGYLKLFPGDEEVKSFSKKITEPSTFFLGLIGASPQIDRTSDPHKKFRVTFHDPCHLRRGMKIYQEPRQLLRSLPGVEFVEMKEPNRCCGMGGSFNLIYYGLSKKVMHRKIDDIEKADADYVVTSCMGCMIQLQDGLHQRAAKTRAAHLVEVLDKTVNS
ncbi:MAG: (Fe-S)-binding protein [Deltaproteobacteria bacterium]|nr:(Fe-S)-binding protein [Deltaproteobacteria bacterium]